MIVDIKTLCLKLKFTRATIDRYKSLGMPVMPDGRFDLEACKKWRQEIFGTFGQNKKQIRRVRKDQKYLEIEIEKEKLNMIGIFGWEGAD